MPREDTDANTVCPSCGAALLESARYCGYCGSSTLQVEAEDPYVGEVVAGRYRITSRIAAGGMGAVYIAEHDTLAQKVAVKLLHRRYAADEHVVARFFNEARSYCRVKHPHAVSLLDFGRLTDGTLFLVTEFVDGMPLTRFIAERGPQTPAFTARLGRQLAEVLAAAHAEGIIHRDLKPDNVMVMEGPGGRATAKVLDFGLAKILDDGDSVRLTQTGAVFGTPEFMSPEQAQGTQVSFATDIYSLAAVLFFALTEVAPFEDEDRARLLKRQVSEPPPLHLLQEAQIPEAFIELIQRCLAKDPADRPDDMLAVLERLEVLEPIMPDVNALARLTEPLDPAGRPLPATEDTQPEVPALLPLAHRDPEPTLDEFEFGDGPPSAATSEIADGSERSEPGFTIGPPPGEGDADDDAYTWGDSDSAILGTTLDVDPSDLQIDHLRSPFRSLLVVLAVALLLGGAGAALYSYVIAPNRGRAPAATPDEGTGSASAAASDTDVEGTGMGTAGSSDEGTAPGPVAAVHPPDPLPPRPFELVAGAALAGRAAALLSEAEVDEAAEIWARATELLAGEEAAELPEVDVAAELAHAQELVAQAEEALRHDQCRRADRVIVEMRDISPQLRRRYLSPLNACQQRVANRGRPPRTLGD